MESHPWAYYFPLEIVDKSESEVTGLQLYVDGPLDYIKPYTLPQMLNINVNYM